ncbi:MAG TPA: DUF5666 domain-containing protein [Methylomirabilota bacterium]|nr:DUF5666 domain-containing protein [Methylomirabilota bacterium]
MENKRTLISWMASATFVLAAAAFLPYAAFGSEPVTLQLAQAEAPKGKPATIRGKISAVDGQNLKVTTSAGDVLVHLLENTRVGGVAAAQLSEIAAGSYVGATATKQADGNLRAIAVNIFPEEGRGTGEGQRPWDLTPDSTMTNANVEKVEQTSVEKVQGQLLTLKYKGGDAKVFIPPGTPIVKSVPGDRSLLKSGVGVYIAAVRGDDGTITATRVAAGVNGVMPPY